MSDDKATNDTANTAEESARRTLRDTIRSTREFLDRTITTARVHSPLAEDKLEAADEAVAGVIHTGYQSVKRVLVNGHPAVILAVAGIAAAAPSIPFGARALIRNTGLGVALAAVMIYPDHLRSYVSRSGKPDGEANQS